MFWGMTLTPNRKYSQACKQSFHISCAALDVDENTKGETKIYVGNSHDRYLLCTLTKNGPRQVMLDLNFMQGEDISIQSIGNGTVSLTGYVTDEFMGGEDEDDDDELGDLEEADLRQAINKKLKQKSKKEQVKALDEEDSDSDDPDFEGMEEEDELDSDDSGDEEEAATGDGDDDDEEEDDDDDDVEEDDDDDEDSEEEAKGKAASPKKSKQNGEKLQRSKTADDDTEDEAMQPSKAKKIKLQNGEKAQNGVAKNQKKEQQQNKQAQQKQKQAGGAEKTLSGGVKIVDLREGTGPEAKVGKRAQVFYEGRLKSNNKVFDSLKQGAGFKFGLGRGEVIKGWDIGVAGMKVGGKRRITCPPHMAYGSKGAPPSIPPNSTLVFDVELKGVH